MLRLLSSVVLLSPALALAQQSSGNAFAAMIGLQRAPRVDRALAGGARSLASAISGPGT